MRCGTCCADIYICSACDEVCSTPLCEDCVSGKEMRGHEPGPVLLPQLDPSLLD